MHLEVLKMMTEVCWFLEASFKFQYKEKADLFFSKSIELLWWGLLFMQKQKTLTLISIFTTLQIWQIYKHPLPIIWWAIRFLLILMKANKSLFLLCQIHLLPMEITRCRFILLEIDYQAVPSSPLNLDCFRETLWSMTWVVQEHCQLQNIQIRL